LVAARARDYGALEKHASEIAGFADELRSFADRQSFSCRDREVFLTYVDRLRERAGELGRAAEAHKGPKVKHAFAKLTATCNSCHSAFREEIKTRHQLAGYRHSDGCTE
jgi:cytochrome c556